MSNTLYVSDHPLVKHKLAKLRDTKTKSKQFRDLIREIAVLLAYEGSRKCELKSVTISTPVADAPGEVFKNTSKFISFIISSFIHSDHLFLF